MEFIKNPEKVKVKLTADKANELYGKIIQYGNADKAFKNATKDNWCLYANTDYELNRIINEIDTIMYSEDQPTTQNELENRLSSEYLDIHIVVNDYRVWSDGNPDNEPVYEDWALTYNTEI